MTKINGWDSTKSKQKRQHTYNSQPAIVVMDALVPARETVDLTRYSASKRMGEEQRHNSKV